MCAVGMCVPITGQPECGFVYLCEYILSPVYMNVYSFILVLVAYQHESSLMKDQKTLTSPQDDETCKSSFAKGWHNWLLTAHSHT